MTNNRKSIILIDLPVFPKGVISLSLLSVAGCLSAAYDSQIIDLNISAADEAVFTDKAIEAVGLKVSAQSFSYAVELSKKIKSINSEVKVMWGGELPSLLPDECLKHADCIICGLFEPVAEQFVSDLKTGSLSKQYNGGNDAEQVFSAPDFSLLPQAEKYAQFMGYPLETSRGCTEKCIFCMVHTMQKKNYNLKQIDYLKGIIHNYRGKFINIVDYNFGVSEAHVVEVAKLIKQSGAIGWMAEMCIELLDNENVLRALSESNCKMIYCGLESIDQQSLNSVHKMNTNHIESYERIIRRAQSYGIQIAAGVILGIEGTHDKTFDELFAFYQRMGIIYAKLTFLIFNPGTKAHEYEKKKGIYLTERIECFDGNQLTFLPNGVNQDYVKSGASWFIKKYYSLYGIVMRSFNTKLSLLQRLEFILFNLCYRDVYMQWIQHDTLHHPENLSKLIKEPYKKSFTVRIAEALLQLVRRKQIKQ